MVTKTWTLGMLAASISLFLGLISREREHYHTHQMQHTCIYFTFASMLLYISLDRYIVKTVSSYNYLCSQSNATRFPFYNSKHKAASELTTPICIRNTNLITVFAISVTISSQNTVFQHYPG